MSRYVKPGAVNWHKNAHPDEWVTGGGQVIKISEMGNTHLAHSLRFAMTKPRHRSRLSALLYEVSLRMTNMDRELAGEMNDHKY